MEVTIKELLPVKVMGMKIQTSIARQETSRLWRPFRQSIKDQQSLSPEIFYSISKYGNEVKNNSFTVETIFEKWAAIETQPGIPDGFEKTEIEGGMYAVFEFTGSQMKFHSVLQEFYQNWLPNSGYVLDSRAHFETFDNTYDPFSESSVEQIWIPVTSKKQRIELV